MILSEAKSKISGIVTDIMMNDILSTDEATFSETFHINRNWDNQKKVITTKMCYKKNQISDCNKK